MYRRYQNLQCKLTGDDLCNLPEFLDDQGHIGMFGKGMDYVVIDKNVGSVPFDLKHARYYRLELLEDHLLPYPVSIKSFTPYILDIEFENGEVKQLDVECFLTVRPWARLKDFDSFRTATIKDNGIYWDEECFFADDVYVYCN